jgi:hypothetical protein
MATAVQTVDLWIDQLKAAGTREATAWQLDNWVRAQPERTVAWWAGQASQILQQHAWAQRRMGTRHRITCSRRGPDAPWFVDYDGSWNRCLDLKVLQAAADTFRHQACHALPHAKAEDARNGHVKLKLADADGPALAACKAKLLSISYGLNAALTVAGLKAVDVDRLARVY